MVSSCSKDRSNSVSQNRRNTRNFRTVWFRHLFADFHVQGLPRLLLQRLEPADVKHVKHVNPASFLGVVGRLEEREREREKKKNGTILTSSSSKRILFGWLALKTLSIGQAALKQIFHQLPRTVSTHFSNLRPTKPHSIMNCGFPAELWTPHRSNVGDFPSKGR